MMRSGVLRLFAHRRWSAPPRRSTRAHRTRSPASQVFRAHSDLVVLHVNVFDGRSDAVPDLPQDAFSVVEDDKPQEITFFSGADVPVAVGLILDNSGSMIARQKWCVAGGPAFADASHPEDELFTISSTSTSATACRRPCRSRPTTTLLQCGAGALRARGQDGAARRRDRGLDHLERDSTRSTCSSCCPTATTTPAGFRGTTCSTGPRRSDTIIYTVSNANRRTIGGEATAGCCASWRTCRAASPTSRSRPGSRRELRRDRRQHPPRLQHRLRADQHQPRRRLPACEGHGARARPQQPQRPEPRWLHGAITPAPGDDGARCRRTHAGARVGGACSRWLERIAARHRASRRSATSATSRPSRISIRRSKTVSSTRFSRARPRARRAQRHGRSARRGLVPRRAR